jgi:hypothetical protein
MIYDNPVHPLMQHDFTDKILVLTDIELFSEYYRSVSPESGKL